MEKEMGKVSYGPQLREGRKACTEVAITESNEERRLSS
jgi:hypothetical protein